ncbi:transglutaminase domain-containing protein [Rhodopila sp.]|uniref:transglutaminase domain-containing protein n=1 Tax=Rhodopila sp. TaxID=2480087 RepID=UPI003D0B00ED
MVTSGVDRWTDHTPMSDPGSHTPALAGFPANIDVLHQVIQGVLVHSDWLAEYGLDEKLLHAGSRQTLPVARRLTDIFERDARHLHIPRSPDRRAIGTCRDFALLLCAMLRGKGVSARMRCGFASYFREGWEDHWVCEYWDKSARAWRLSDPQLDPIQREKCRIEFDPTDVPRQSFVTADKAWLDCRAGRSNPSRFGHGQTTGLWFLKVNLIRDHYVINNQETSPWDTWRAAPSSMRAVGDHDAAMLDALAAMPERPLVEIKPDWVA